MFYQSNHPSVSISKETSLINEDHLHNEIEMIICTKGNFEAIVDNVGYPVERGQIFLSFPNQRHYYICNTEPLECYILIFSYNILKESENYIKSSLPENPVATAQNFDMIVSLCEVLKDNHNSIDDFAKLKSIGYCKVLCGEILSNFSFVPEVKSNSDVIENIIKYCNENYMNEIHLSDIEENVHVNRYYISHLFKHKIKMGFNEYIHSMRIKDACKQLSESDLSITVIASNVGYNTVRSFNRSFLKITGCTPSKYREIKSKNNKE